MTSLVFIMDGKRKGGIAMPFVVTDNCIKCKYTDCVDVCPIDCFYEGPNFLVIGDECIECNLCAPECPADAIFSDDELPEDQVHFVEINLELSIVWPNITIRKAPLEGADEQNGVTNKLKDLEK